MAEVSPVAALLQIIGSDLVLSGDNAVVIGLAVQHLRQPLRRRAVLLGTVGAIVLRVVFTIFATFLLTIPLLSALGGVTLFWIGYKLLADIPEQHDDASEVKDGFFNAIRTIVIADAVMSLDNALAVAGAAKGDLLLLLIGLGLSIPLLMIGSNFVSSLFNRLPWLTLVGAALIAWVGADLIHSDHLLGQWLPFLESNLTLWLMRVVAVAAVIGLGLRAQRLARLREDMKDAARAQTVEGSD
jgi:YjbE family integral membrane protein